MELKKIGHKLTVCKVTDITNIDLTADFYFIGKTDEELSLVCKTEDTPIKALEREDRKSTRLNSSYIATSRMPSSA